MNCRMYLDIGLSTCFGICFQKEWMDRKIFDKETEITRTHRVEFRLKLESAEFPVLKIWIDMICKDQDGKDVESI